MPNFKEFTLYILKTKKKQTGYQLPTATILKFRKFIYFSFIYFSNANLLRIFEETETPRWFFVQKFTQQSPGKA